jgi:hypothetical protein
MFSISPSVISYGTRASQTERKRRVWYVTPQ